ncbi:hypothetical protein B8W95_14060, partial [Staphylococcus pasteuri]
EDSAAKSKPVATEPSRSAPKAASKVEPARLGSFAASDWTSSRGLGTAATATAVVRFAAGRSSAVLVGRRRR